MKKRRLPSLRRQGREPDPSGVGFEDLPPDERSSEVVMHPSPAGAPRGDDPDDTKPRPTMPASAVVLHDESGPAADPISAADAEDADYAFRPPTDAEPPVSVDDADDAIDATNPPVPDVVVDADVRDEVLASLAVSTFVEGPPGSGVSTLLVERIVASLRTARVDAGSLAAVTRDAGGGARMRDRLRDALEAAAGEEGDDVVRRRLGAAVAELRSAPIGPGTVLAEGILRRWPEAAGVSPGFTVLPDPLARIELEATFADWLAGPAADEPAVVRALARGVSPNQVHGLAEAFTRHLWLLPRAAAAGRTAAEPDLDALREESTRRIGELVTLATHGTPGDDGVVQIRALERWLGDSTESGDAFAGHFLDNAPTKVRAAGSRANWDPPETCAQQIEQSRELHAAWSRARRSLGRSTMDALVDVIARFVRSERSRRAHDGRLFASDVVPAALDLLATDAGVRRIERDRHGLVVVDEIWDVDAPTLALVLVLTSLSDDVDDPFGLRPGPGRLLAGGAATTATLRSQGADLRLVARLRDHGTTPLRLQTGFRQAPVLLSWTTAACRELFGDDADVQVEPMASTPAPRPAPPADADADADANSEASLGAAEDAADDGAGVAKAPSADDAAGPGGDPHSAVSTNELPLPAAPGVLTPEGHLMAPPAVDATVDEGADDEDDAGSGSSPVVEAPPAPIAAPDPSDWGPVVAAWGHADTDSADTAALRSAEAAAVAAALRMLVDSAAPCVGSSDGTPRPASWSDCALVLGSGAGLETYLDALGAASVPYTRRSTGAELLRRQEVQDLLAILRAVDDPTDVVSTLAALRGLGFGCSDGDLVAAVGRTGGALTATATPAEEMPAPVAASLQVLARLGEDRELPALAVVDLAVELTGFRAAVVSARGADPASIDALRGLAVESCGEAGPIGTFLAYVDAVLRPLVPATVTRPPQPPGGGAIEVLTAAEARGRELPVVAVANLHRLRVPMPSGVADYSARSLHVRAGRPDRGLVTAGFDAALARDDEEYLAQRTRLVCSAFSRARDVLVIALTVAPDDVDTDAEVPRRELVRRVARLLVEPDTDAPGGVRARPGVTLVPVAASPPLAAPTPTGDPTAAAAPDALRDAPRRALATLGTAPDDPVRAALALAFSRADFENAPVATAPVTPEAVAAACLEVGAAGSETEVSDLLEVLMDTDLWARADGAQRVLRHPSVFLDGGAEGAFTDHLDLAMVEDGAVVGVVLSLTGADGRLRTRVALGTHALAYAAGLEVGAALVVDARRAEVVELDRAAVDALVEETLSTTASATPDAASHDER